MNVLGRGAAIVVWLALGGAAAQVPVPPVIPPPKDIKVPLDITPDRTGFASRVIRPGAGVVHPALDDSVLVHFTGWTADGRMFDSTVARGVPQTIHVGNAIKGLQTGLRLMVTGEVRRMWIPRRLGYVFVGPRGALVFDVELLAIEPRR